MAATTATVDGIVEGPGVTPLQRGYTFYYINKQKGSATEVRCGSPPKQPPHPPYYPIPALHPPTAPPTNHTKQKYEDSIKRVASFRTAEGFWRVYNHMLRPHQLREGGGEEYQLFVEGVKPTWEDQANTQGGKLVIRLPPALTSRYWEELLLAVIGEQLDGGEDEVCGVIVSVRYNGDVISIWNRNADNREFQTKLVRRIKSIWDLPPFVQMDYKRHVPLPEGTKPPPPIPGLGGEPAPAPPAEERRPAWRTARGAPSSGTSAASSADRGSLNGAGGRERGPFARDRGERGGGLGSGERGERREAWPSRDRAGSADKGEWRSRGE